MAVGIFFYPESMNATQYAEILQKLNAAGAGRPRGRLHHFAFGDEDALMVVDVWETQEDFEAFGESLAPILEEMGIEAEPGLLPMHNHILG